MMQGLVAALRFVLSTLAPERGRLRGRSGRKRA